MCEQIAQHATRGIYYPGGDPADVLQEARIGVWKALRAFRSDGGTPFKTFAEFCARRQVIDALKTARALKQRSLNTAASLDALIPLDDGEGTLADLIVHPACDPCEAVIVLDEIRGVFSRFERLSPWERECAERVLLNGEGAGYSSRVHNGVYRARRKLSEAA